MFSNMHVWQLTVNDDIKSIALHLSSVAVQCCAAVKAIFYMHLLFRT